jgi:hypothetical protein
MAANNSLPFIYHANAFALSGEFIRPVRRSIDVQAGVSLPPAGGNGQANVENFSVDHLVRFLRGYSHVSGSTDSKGHYTTHITAALEGLNILDVVTADRVIARLTADHDPAKREGHIIALGSRFDNLRIAGCAVQVELDHELFLKNKTHADLSKKVASLKKSGRIADESHGVVICSLAKSVDVKCPGVEVEGHVITVPQFGKIYIAEVISLQGAKVVCMMRFKLGSPHEGQLAAGGGNVNGTPFP